jgi:hypothetical protein
LKKPTDSVQFRFYKPKTEKTKSNQTKPKPVEPNWKKTEPNRFKPVFVLKNRTETGRFEPVSVFLKKKFDLVIFFYKNRIESKMITPN